MHLPNKPIFFIGFKHVGKSTIARAVASHLQWPFLDLDEALEKHFANNHAASLTCREITQQHGLDYFRALEATVFQTIALDKPCMVALGGGAPLQHAIRKILEKQTVIYITAPKSVVFQRIMIKGRPTIFNPELSAKDAFNQLWHQRQYTYKKLATYSVENRGSLQSAVEKVLQQLDILGSVDNSLI